MYRRLGGPQSLSEQRREEKILDPTGTRTLNPRSFSPYPVAIPNALSRLLNLPYVYDYITKLCRRQAKGIHNNENKPVRSIGIGEVRHGKYKRLKLGGGQAYDRSSD
jgi:hypothetical protein